MHAAPALDDGTAIRWAEIPGAATARVYLHGLGASSPHYYTGAACHPVLAGRRSLLVDLLGHGASDRPSDFPYTLEAHADALAAALSGTLDGPADVIAHSMGGAVAINLATRHPGLVRRLVLVDANLDPYDADTGGSGIAAHTEEAFLSRGRDEVLRRVGPRWAATMRIADPVGLHRTAVHLARGSRPAMRTQLLALDLPRTFMYPAADGAPAGAAGLAAAGVDLVAVPDSGHNIMLDNVDAFAAAVARALD